MSWMPLGETGRMHKAEVETNLSGLDYAVMARNMLSSVSSPR